MSNLHSNKFIKKLEKMLYKMRLKALMVQYLPMVKLHLEKLILV